MSILLCLGVGRLADAGKCLGCVSNIDGVDLDPVEAWDDSHLPPKPKTDAKEDPEPETEGLWNPLPVLIRKVVGQVQREAAARLNHRFSDGMAHSDPLDHPLDAVGGNALKRQARREEPGKESSEPSNPAHPQLQFYAYMQLDHVYQISVRPDAHIHLRGGIRMVCFIPGGYAEGGAVDSHEEVFRLEYGKTILVLRNGCDLHHSCYLAIDLGPDPKEEAERGAKQTAALLVYGSPAEPLGNPAFTTGSVFNHERLLEREMKEASRKDVSSYVSYLQYEMVITSTLVLADRRKSRMKYQDSSTWSMYSSKRDEQITFSVYAHDCRVTGKSVLGGVAKPALMVMQLHGYFGVGDTDESRGRDEWHVDTLQYGDGQVHFRDYDPYRSDVTYSDRLMFSTRGWGWNSKENGNLAVLFRRAHVGVWLNQIVYLHVYRVSDWTVDWVSAEDESGETWKFILKPMEMLRRCEKIKPRFLSKEEASRVPEMPCESPLPSSVLPMQPLALPDINLLVSKTYKHDSFWDYQFRNKGWYMRRRDRYAGITNIFFDFPSLMRHYYSSTKHKYWNDLSVWLLWDFDVVHTGNDIPEAQIWSKLEVYKEMHEEKGHMLLFGRSLSEF